MAALRVRSRHVTAMALVLGSAALSGAAMQTATPQRDSLKFDTAKPALILFSIQANKAADFEKFWTEMQAALNGSDLAEVKTFAATFGRFAKVDAASATPGAPVQYLVQLPSPSITQSYNPGDIVGNFLFRYRRAISRAQADGLSSKFRDLVAEGLVDITAFQTTR